jgi:hypothetical protein
MPNSTGLSAPVIRPANSLLNDPTVPATWVYESPTGIVIPVGTENDAREYVLDNKLHRKYGRVYIETAPKKFATLIVDDRADDEEAEFDE